ncbi:Ig-like domain-containing protein [candidate division WOR-3 bacterium]|nr:Ig-like domain-containing protein [candidate division WOR-3 bacterium]
MRKIVLLIGFIPLFLQGANITRSSVISSAQGYAGYNWTVNMINPRYPIYSVSGRNITGEAYSYGDKATTSYFQSEINGYRIPRNWEENFNSSTQALYTGIDCSGLVTRCWCFGNQVDWVGASDLDDYTIEITGEPKTGDLWWSSGHVFLQSEIHEKVYESNPLWVPGGGNRVQKKDNPYPQYQKRSIFPQFSSPNPGDEVVLEDSQTVNISLTIKASGTLVSGGVSMMVNGVQVSNPELQPQGDNTWTLTASNYDVSKGGKFNVRVIAQNNVTISQVSPSVTNGYFDEYNWWFIVNADSTPPMVVSTNPPDGATDVQVDINPISIAFSRAMDTSSTGGAISITPAISYTISWTNEDKTLNLHPDYYFDYFKEYTVTILEAATDTFGIHLDADGDGIPLGKYRFSFNTQTPPLTHYADPSCHLFKPPGGGIDGNVRIDGSALKKTVSGRMDRYQSIYNA